MKRALLILVAVAALGATLVSTGAFVDTVEDTEEKIEMSPSDGPNAVYAVNESGEIKLDLSASNQALAEDAEGINEGSLTEIPNIFTVNYSTAADDEPVEVWFTSDAEEGIEFVVGTDSVAPIDGEDSKRTLEPNEKLHIGVTVDTRGTHDVEDVSEFTIHVETIDEDSGQSQGDASNQDGQAEEDETSTQDEVTNQDDTESEDQDDSDPESEDEDDSDTESEDEGDDETEGESGEDDAESEDSEDDTESETEDDEETDDTDQGDSGTGEESGSEGENGGDGNTGQEGSGNDEDDGSEEDPGEESTDDGGGLQTAGQQPSFPGPEETLGGFLARTFLFLTIAVLTGASLFAAMRYGTDLFGGEQ